jgi:hypothetical protein
MYTLLNPDPATILTKNDFEVPRTLPNFETWWQDRHNALGVTKETRAYARLNEGLPKRLYGEAQPMLALMRAQAPEASIRCQVFADDKRRDSAEDAVYLNPQGKVIRRFQVVFMDNLIAKQRRRQLSLAGHVDGLSDPDDNGQFDDLALPNRVDLGVQAVCNELYRLIALKNAKAYGPGFTLVVGFVDPFGGHHSEHYDRFLVRCEHAFANLYIVEVNGAVTRCW